LRTPRRAPDHNRLKGCIVKTPIVFVPILFATLLTERGLAQGVFTSADIGSASPVGQTVAATNGYDVSSATGDIWDFQDDFRFVYRQVTGDFDFQARIQGFTAAAYWSKAGLMLRGDLTDYSMNGLMAATPAAGWDRYMFTARVTDFDSSYVHFQGSYERVKYPNVWLRLVRVGNNIIPLHSTNGVSWTQIGNLSFVTWPSSVLVGTAVSNHPDSGSVKATAQFRDISLDEGVPTAPVILTQPVSQMMNPGTDVTFSVTTVGLGPLNYQWYRDGNLLDGATSAAYRLNAAQPGDAAKFTCHVWNDAGDLWSWAGQLGVEEAGQPFDGIDSELFRGIYGRLIAYDVMSGQC
jgi:regulation of enolase protein 1 (concanavalin A-like superfamily)